MSNCTGINQVLEQVILLIRLSQLMDMMLNSAENGKHTGMILIDLN